MRNNRSSISIYDERMLIEGQKASSKCPHPEFASSILKPAAMDRTMSVRSAGRTSSSAVMANGASTKTEALFWLTPAVQCHQPPWPCITFSTAKSLTHRSERMSLRAFCAQWRVWSPWPRIGQRSSNDTARHGSRAVHAGSASGNARCAYGRIFNGIQSEVVVAKSILWCRKSVKTPVAHQRLTAALSNQHAPHFAYFVVAGRRVNRLAPFTSRRADVKHFSTVWWRT